MFDEELFERLDVATAKDGDPVRIAIVTAMCWGGEIETTAETLLVWLQQRTSLENDYDPDDEPVSSVPSRFISQVMKESVVTQPTLDGRTVTWTRDGRCWRRVGAVPWPPPVPPSPSGVVLVEADMRRRASEEAWAPRNELGQIVKDPRSEVHNACLLQETEGRCLYCGGRPDSPLHRA